MRIQTEDMSFENCWTISSSYDFQTHHQRSQGRWFSQTALPWFKVLTDMSPSLRGLSSAHLNLSPVLQGSPKVLSSAPGCSQTLHNHSHGTPVPIIRGICYSEGPPECPPRVWYCPELNASMFTLHILPHIPGGSQWVRYIFVMTCPTIICDERVSNLLRRQNSAPSPLSEIQSTPLQRHPPHTSAFEPILVLKMSGVAETFNSSINVMKYGTDFKLITLLHPDNSNITQQDLNTRIDKLENGWNIPLVSQIP